MLDLQKPRTIKLPSKLTKVIVVLIILGAGYVGIMVASHKLNDFLFGIYNVQAFK